MDVKKRRSTKPQTLGDLMVIMEMAVLEVVVGKRCITPGEKKEIESNHIGDLCSHIVKMKWGEKARSTLKGFLAAAMQLTPSRALELDTIAGAWEQIMDRAVFHDGDQNPGTLEDPWQPQPLRGHQVKCKATTIQQTGNPNLDFTQIEYFKIEDEDPEVEA